MSNIKIVVPAIPPSNNKFIGNSHSHWLYKKPKEEWHWMIRAALTRTADKPKAPIKRATVTLRYFFKDRRRRDPDNYSGKFILDALVREGVLVDDSFENIRLVLIAEVDRKNPRTEIYVDEVC